MKIARIYFLSDPINYQIRYVGKTIKSLETRLGEHISAANRPRTYVQKWIKLLLDKGQIPKITETQQIHENESAFVEKKWIALLRSIGCPLTNLTDGGDGSSGYIPTEETRKKQSEALKGKNRKPKSEETKRKISESVKISMHKPEIRKKVIEGLRGLTPWNKGIPRTEEEKEKIRKGHLGKPSPNKGNKYSPERCRQMSEARKGQIAWNKGKSWSEEIRKKISDGHKRTSL